MEDTKMKLNIGCGNKAMEGYINIDKFAGTGVDMVVDIEQGLPFEDNSFEEIYSCNCLEHIRPEKWDFVLREINRVAKPNCKLYLTLPFDNTITRTDADHYRTFTWWSFLDMEDNMELHKVDGGLTKFYTYCPQIRLRRLKPFPNKFVRLFFALFPLLKNEIEFEYLIIK